MSNRTYTVERMKILATTVFGIAAFLASAGLVTAQSPTMMPKNPLGTNQGQSAPNQSSTATYAPSEIAVSPSGIPDDHPSRNRQRAVLRASAAAGPKSAGLNIPHLCFQDGIGWTAVADADFAALGDTKQKTSDGDGTGNNNPQQGNRGLSAASMLGKSGECPPTPLAQTALGESNDDINHQDSNTDVKSALLNPNPEQTTYNNFQPLVSNNLLSGSQSSPLAKPSMELPDGLKSNGSYNSNDPNVALEQLKALRRRAYISPVKLRRLSRNMQDLETRLEMRQMNVEVQKRKAKKSSDDQNTGDKSGKDKEHKPLDAREQLAKKAGCDRKVDASKTQVCALLKH